MKVAIGYVYPIVSSRQFFPAAMRFCETLKRCPGGYDFDLHVLCNGGDPPMNYLRPFNGMRHQVIIHDNSGWDIGAYQKFADIVPCDLMVCFGAFVHFHRAGWLERMVEAYIQNGPGLYGCWAYMSPDVHIRTTAFWFPPVLLQSYPFIIGSSRESRYDFEHRTNSFTRHAMKAGLPCMLVTWGGSFPCKEWHNHAPTARDLLVWDNHGHG